MVSVIVITYNEEKTIGRTLDSILMQKCRMPIEIVVGEDASTDRTREICEDYAKRYPQILLMPKAPNKGVVDNYFDCIEASHGKYIADCAGDDYWVTDDKLEKELDLMESDEGITLVHTDWMCRNEQTGELTSPPSLIFNKPITDGKIMKEAIVTQTSRPIIHLCTALYRKDVFMEEYLKDRNLFRNKEFGCEDLQICFVMANRGMIGYIPEVTLYYSVGNATVSNTHDSIKQYKFVKRVSNLSFYLCRKYKLESNAIDQYFCDRVFALLMHAFRANDKQLATDANSCAKEWGVRPTFKMKFVSFVMQITILWSIALSFRNFIKKLQ